jgi:hypothetical protein
MVKRHFSGSNTEINMNTNNEIVSERIAARPHVNLWGFNSVAKIPPDKVVISNR